MIERIFLERVKKRGPKNRLDRYKVVQTENIFHTNVAGDIRPGDYLRPSVVHRLIHHSDIFITISLGEDETEA